MCPQDATEAAEEPSEKEEEGLCPGTSYDDDEEIVRLFDDLDVNETPVDDSIITDDDFDENGEPVFPHDLLAKLDEMVNKPKWIIPVLPKAELELLMDATIKLAKKGEHKFSRVI